MLHPRAGLVFPGGGLFFWWQAGAISGLQRRIDLSRPPLAGGSAGALAATLAACEVEMPLAFDTALQMSNEAGVFEKGAWGLYGIWGALVADWLDKLLPEDAADRCRGRVNIIIREVKQGLPPVSPIEVSDFESRADLIASCMASAHVPFFLDKHMTRNFRGKQCVDGSLSVPGLSPVRYALPKPYADLPVVRVSPFRDRRMRAHYGSPSDFLRLSGVEAPRDMMTWGESYVDIMAEEGQLDGLLEASDS